MKQSIFFLGLIFILSLEACQKKATANAPTDKGLTYTKETVSYKQMTGINQNLLNLDVYFDSEKLSPKPVIVWIHGGGWCIGDKANQMENKKQLFASLGYILVSVNYRLSPFPYQINNQGRIKFPVHNVDIADAIKWITDHITTYGGDTNQIVLLGHSAGAHLVALTGTNQNFLQQAGVQIEHIKGIACIDTRMYDVYDVIQNHNNPDDMYLNAFGTDPQDNIAASPIRQLNNHSYIPKFFVAKRGNYDRIIRANQFINALQQAGAEVAELEANIYTHSEINDAIGAENETIITPALVSFIKNCLNND